MCVDVVIDKFSIPSLTTTASTLPLALFLSTVNIEYQFPRPLSHCSFSTSTVSSLYLPFRLNGYNY